jgi:glycosyltransferase involved in cell wall biosynthesis
VIAYPFGSIPEVIQDGVNGYIVPDIESAVSAVRDAMKLDRKKIRKSFEQRFTASRMTQDYLKIYNRILSRKKGSLAVADGVLNWMKLTSPSSTT